LRISLRSRDGAEHPFLRLRLQAQDRLELLPKDGAEADAAPEIAYRCGAPDTRVTAAVPMQRLALLTPNASGGEGFIEAVPGIPDADICAGKVEDRNKHIERRPRGLQFELLGPVHYWIMGANFGEGQNHMFDYVRSVETVDRHTLKLHMQTHLERGDGWDVADSRGARYDLTIIDRDSRFEIPEWSASFIRCPLDSEASRGAHRY